MEEPVKRTAFTLVELLVVIAIIGILIGLLLPAINAAREAGRRAQCENNLKQLAFATLAYTDEHGAFPPACTWIGNDPSNPAGGKDNWVIMILPYTEYNPLYKQFNHNKPISDLSNAAARGTVIPTMLCPSDQYNRKPFNGLSGQNSASMGNNWARGNYGANGSLGLLENNSKAYRSGGLGTPGWQDQRVRGIMGSGCSLTPAQVVDGLSHTILLAEIRAGVADYDTRGVWAMSGACPSGIWGVGSFAGDDAGPNNPYYAADDMINCKQLRAAYGDPSSDQSGSAGLGVQTNMPCSDVNMYNEQQTARSVHTGGIYGGIRRRCTVHWISDFVQSSGGSESDPSIWDRLIASGDGKTVSGGDF